MGDMVPGLLATAPPSTPARPPSLRITSPSATLPTIWFFMSPPTTLRCSVVESTTRLEPDSKLELPLTLPLPETPTLELVASMLWEMMLVLEQRLITPARLDLAISRA